MYKLPLIKVNLLPDLPLPKVVIFLIPDPPVKESLLLIDHDPLCPQCPLHILLLTTLQSLHM